MACAPSLKASFEPFFPWLRLKPLSKILVMVGLIMGSSLGAQAEGVFDYGIASGDPDASSVVLWTHLSPSDADDIDTAIPVRWEVAETPDFAAIVAVGASSAQAERDHTVKVVAAGLEPGKTYFYRFIAGEAVSPVGTTRVLPQGAVESLKLAVFSCVNYPAGLFNAYDAAVQEGFDFSVHLGDYIYEYGPGGYATKNAAALGRMLSPPNEVVTAADYRERYRLYTADPDLQALRAAAPMIMMWDDHETANDSWLNGADNHNPEDQDAQEFGVA